MLPRRRTGSYKSAFLQRSSCRGMLVDEEEKLVTLGGSDDSEGRTLKERAHGSIRH